VINWTHNDRQVRIRVTVGVVYGSPTREVERLIGKALEEYPDASLRSCSTAFRSRGAADRWVSR
jgi:hypothetical protein